MILFLIVLPAFGSFLAFLIRNDTLRRALLILIVSVHAGTTACTWFVPAAPVFDGWMMLDAPGRLILNIVSGLFFAASFYVIAYLHREGRRAITDSEEAGLFFVNAPEAIFIGCLLLLLSAMTLVTVSQHLGLFWVAMEASTLATGSLIYFHRHHRSLEAAWKYVLIGSVGIAMALLGNFFLATAGSFSKGIGLLLPDLVRRAPELNLAWLKAATIFLFVGYGTKMGLAPMHTWKPEAYSEAPAVVSALLAGALTNCAFLGVLRTQQVCAAAGHGAFGQDLLILFGLFSMGVGAAFIVGQNDYKRMLAYSSVEHMGILVLGVGIGGLGVYGALFHALNNALAKPMLFLVASNIRSVYKTRSAPAVTGVLKVLPATGVLWIVGFLATTGFPPFGLFLSEFIIFKASLDQGHPVLAGIFLSFLAIVFIGVATIVLRMAQGTPPKEIAAYPIRESIFFILPPALLGITVLMLGLFIPPSLNDLLKEAARELGGS